MDIERVKERVWNAQAAVGVVLMLVGLGLVVSPIAQGGVLGGSGPPDYECGPAVSVQHQSLGVGASGLLQQQDTNNATVVAAAGTEGPGQVIAVDAGSGEEIWNYSTNAQVLSSPTVSDGTVYVGTGESGGFDPNPGSFYALDLTDGSVEWRINGTRIVSSPSVTDDYVFVAENNGSAVYAIDRDDGSIVWENSTRSWDYVTDSASIKNGTVYIAGGGGDSGVAGYNATTGNEEFYHSANLDKQNTQGGVVYAMAGDDHILEAVSADSSSVLWSFDPSNSRWWSPVVDGDFVYTTFSNSIYKVNNSGGEVWNFSQESAGSPTTSDFGGVTASDANIISGTEGGSGSEGAHVHAINKTTGNETWNYSIGTEAQVLSTPTVYDGVVYVTTTTPTDSAGSLIALNASSGDLLWIDSIGPSSSSPTVVPSSSRGYSDGSRINEETLGMHGGIPICTGLWVDTDEYLPHNNSSKFVVRAYDDSSEQWENVTDDSDLSVSVDQSDVVDVHLDNATITSTRDRSVNERVTITATLDNFEGEQQVTVANETIAQYDILPPMQKFSSALGDDNTLIVLIATGVGAGVAVFATSLAGLGAFALVVIGGWLGGFAGDHVVISALLVTLFVGLNVSQLVEFDRR